MAWGGYGRNSPAYPSTTTPYQPPRQQPVSQAPVAAPTPVPAPAPAPVARPEYCTACSERVEARFVCCPYCGNDLNAARAKRKTERCQCGVSKCADDKHCYNCGRRNN